MLTLEELILLLRQSLNISGTVTITDDEGNEKQVTLTVTKDKAYLDMTDDDLTLFFKLCATRDYQIDDLEDLPPGAEYPLMLLAQIELFKKLAVSVADWIDLGADNNNYLKREQRFKHYMQLAAMAQEQYDDYVESGGASGGVQTYTVRLKGNHMSERDYELTPSPRVSLKIKNVTNESADISWTVTGISHFGRYKLFISTSPIVDMYLDGAKHSDKITEGAVLIKSTHDIKDTYHRITGLDPETVYYVALVSIEKNSTWGYTEKSFTTLEPFEEEPDVDIGDLNPDNPDDGDDEEDEGGETGGEENGGEDEGDGTDPEEPGEEPETPEQKEEEESEEHGDE